MLDDPLETVPDDLAEARAKLEAARNVLQPLLKAPEGDLPEIRQALAQLARIEAEVDKIERVLAGQAVGDVRV